MSDALVHTILYIEPAIYSLFIMITVLFFQKNRLGSHVKSSILKGFIHSAMLFMFSDICWAVLDHFRRIGYDTSSLIWLNYFINIIYFVTRSLLAYFWLLYCECVFNRRFIEKKFRMILCAIPASLDILLIFASPINGWLFTIDSTGNYLRGPYYNAHQLVFCFYLLTALVRTIGKVASKKEYVNHDKYVTMLAFCFPLLLGSILQVLFLGIPILATGICISMLQMQFASTNLLVTADELTGLNNRNQLTKYLDTKMRSFSGDFMNQNSLFLFVIDVDDFKLINDNYGHVEGDEALRIVANSLKTISGRYNCFCSRYGGDEFVLVGEFYDGKSAETLVRDLSELVENNNRFAGNDYKLSLSIGFAQYGDDTPTIPEYIDKADKMLYQIKKAKKVGR